MTNHHQKAGAMTIGLVLVIVALAAALIVVMSTPGRGPGGTDKPEPIVYPERNRQEIIQDEDRQPAAPSTPIDAELVRQRLEAGKRYRTVVEGRLQSRGTHKDWGIEVASSMQFEARAEILRDIISNDGTTIELVMEYKQARQVIGVTQVEGISIRLPRIVQFALDGAGVLASEGMLPIGWSEVGIESVNQLLESDSAREAMAALSRDPNAKIFVFLNELEGKRFRVTYVNGEGVTEAKCLNGEVSDEAWMVVLGTNILSDAYLLPDELSEPGSDWRVPGQDIQSIFDPSMHFLASGYLRASRLENTGSGAGRRAWVRLEEDSAIVLRSQKRGRDTLGTWRPTGKLEYSMQDRIFVFGEMNGEIELIRRSTDHIIFEMRLTQKPVYTLKFYGQKMEIPAESAREWR